MRFSDFLKESNDNKWNVNWPTAYKKADADSIKAVKSVLSKNDVLKAIRKEMTLWQGASDNVDVVDSTLSIYGTYKDGDTVYAYLQYVFSDEIDEESLEAYDDVFNEGDTVYSNGYAIFNLNSGKFVTAGNEEANELHSSIKIASSVISANAF